jgi:hypothetical protein
VTRNLKIATLLLVFVGALFAQPKPRIDFDRLIAALPDLPWDFEIRYVVHEGPQTDMLRSYYDARADVIRWRPEYTGSLASVCHGNLDGKTMRRLLELLRDKKFNDLPTDSDSVVTIALTRDATVSVRLGRTIVSKVDRHQRENTALRDIESFIDQLATTVAADPHSKCDMESVPAKP